MPYLIDINWFRYVHCRKPYFQQRANIVNKIEAIQSMIDREESKRR